MFPVSNRQIKDAIRAKYAWPGGYTIFGITSDGACLCCECMRKHFKSILWSRLHNVSDGWKVEAIDSAAGLESREFIEQNTEEYSLTYCDHCNKILND